MSEAHEILGTGLQDETVVPLDPRALADWLDAVLGDRKPTGVVDEFIRERRQEAEAEQRNEDTSSSRLP